MLIKWSLSPRRLLLIFFLAVRHHALPGHRLDALAVRVDQRHRSLVEGLEVVVVEAGPG